MSEFDLTDINFDLDGMQDPLADVPITGDLEQDSQAEISAMLKAFKGRQRVEAVDKRKILDSEYWCCLCFQSRAQKEVFLRAVDWLEHGDKYLDGMWVARKMGVNIPEERVIYNEQKVKKTYTGDIPTIRELPPEKDFAAKPVKRRAARKGR